MVTQEFYQLCKARLSSADVAVVHLFHKQDFNAAVVKTLRVCTSIYMHGNGNVATNAPYLDKNEIVLKAEVIQDFHSLGFSLIQKSLQLKVVSQLLDWVNFWEALPNFTLKCLGDIWTVK
ncbi:MAG TPA: hypothetical protein DCS91_07915 [Microcoleaceae bacterium UBA11344]|nr:hypothetical protein [Microcoleaceae cyanobacterium UBA11344]